MLLEAKGPTSYSQRLILILKVIAIVQLFLGTAKVFLNFFAGMTDIISSLIIFFAAFRLNFCLCSLYVIGDLANVLIIAATIGIYIQNNNQSLFSGEPHKNAFYVISAISIVFYIVACYFAYESYREFKAISFQLFQNTQEKEQRANLNPPRLPSFGRGSFGVVDQSAASNRYFENFHSFGRVSLADSVSQKDANLHITSGDGLRYDGMISNPDSLQVTMTNITLQSPQKFP